MTTPNTEELITYLRSFFIDENVSAIKANWIANALQSQAERIKTLEDQISRKETTLKGWLKENGPGGWIDGLRSQLDVEIKAAAHWMQESCTEHNENVRIHAQLEGVTDTLTSTLELLKERDEQIAEIEKTEPVAWINLAASSKMFRSLAPTEEDGTVVKDWQPLFTHPMPADVTELVEALQLFAYALPLDKSTVKTCYAVNNQMRDAAHAALSKYKGAK